jgi:phosphoglycolate phosphatase
MTIQNIICDLDGTLIDSARLTGQIIDEMLADRGVAASADRDVIRAMDAVGGEAMIAAVMGAHTRDPAADLEDFRARHRTASTPADLAFPGVAETLVRLADDGIGLAICSNKPQYLCEKILADLALDRHFSTIVGSTPGRPRKPAPDAARLAITELGAEPGETLYFGDSLVDLATAEAAGLRMILARWGYGAAEVLAAAPTITVISTMDQLAGTTSPRHG